MALRVPLRPSVLPVVKILPRAGRATFSVRDARPVWRPTVYSNFFRREPFQRVQSQ